MDDILKDFENLMKEVKNEYDKTSDNFLGDILNCVDKTLNNKKKEE